MEDARDIVPSAKKCCTRQRANTCDDKINGPLPHDRDQLGPTIMLHVAQCRARLSRVAWQHAEANLSMELCVLRVSGDFIVIFSLRIPST